MGLVNNVIGHGGGDAGNRKTSPYFIGAYYFPGWALLNNPDHPNRWGRILDDNNCPWRESLMGRYNGEDQYVIDNEINIAASNGIDYFAFDWYWITSSATSQLDQPINNFMVSPNASKMKFCLLVANHFNWPTSLADWDAIVNKWLSSYFGHAQYLKIDSKPLVIIFQPDNLDKKAILFGQSGASLIARANSLVPGGIYFVGATESHPFWVGAGKGLDSHGYKAATAYNYHYTWTNRNTSASTADKGPVSVSFKELSDIYLDSDDWISKNSAPLKYIVPMSCGWNQNGWGSFLPHDNCSPTVNEFNQHLLESRKFMDSTSACEFNVTGAGIRKVGVIYAWNEIGEGGYLTPTIEYQYGLCHQIAAVFKK